MSVLFLFSPTDEFKLRVPERAVGADRGKDVTLSCYLSPKTSAVAMTIRWFKQTECIYLYKNGQVIEGRGYEGRVSLVTQELKGGNVSLRLRDFKESDDGVYICQVTYGGQKEEEAVFLWDRGKCSTATEHDYEHLYMNYDNTVSLSVQIQLNFHM